MIKNAVISDCGKYRYLLTRQWEESLLLPQRKCSLAFIMLNPSTADDTIDDPTIRRCMAFARREGYHGIEVVNLFALRSTDPTEVALNQETAVGPDNDNFIRKIALSCGEVVAAWGAWIFARERSRKVSEMLGGVTIKCLGMNKDGSPKHPLYIPSGAPLISYTVGDVCLKQ